LVGLDSQFFGGLCQNIFLANITQPHPSRKTGL